MEWAFAGADIVKQDVSDIVLKALSELQPAHSYQDIRGERIPVLSKIRDRPTEASKPEAHKFTNLTFSEAIAAYGSDKPDLRIPSRVS
jgi:aspartyl-tRNA synthetase